MEWKQIEILRVHEFEAVNQMSSSMGEYGGIVKKAEYQYNGLGHRMNQKIWKYINYTRTGFLYIIHLKSYPNGINMFNMSTIGDYIKKERKKAGLTQEDFAIRSGLGLRFVRELEQGKETVRLDKVNQALAMFGKEAVPGKREE